MLLACLMATLQAGGLRCCEGARPLILRNSTINLECQIVLKYTTIVLNMRVTVATTLPPLIEVLFGSYRRLILGQLLLRADETFHVREIARITAVPAGSLHRELKLLTNAGILLRTVVGNQVHYQADRSCAIYKELASILRKTVGLANVLRELLAPLQPKLAIALVFGSMAQGKASASSDIDLLVIGTISFAAVVKVCHVGTKQLGREVNPVVMSRAAVQLKLREHDCFISRVLKKPKIFVIGNAGELGQLAGDRSNKISSGGRRRG
jgi:predicted nucleotidyltransferase